MKRALMIMMLGSWFVVDLGFCLACEMTKLILFNQIDLKFAISQMRYSLALRKHTKAHFSPRAPQN